MNIPAPTLSRLSAIYRCLMQLGAQGVKSVSSAELAQMIGSASHSIRKDMSIIGDMGIQGTAGYNVEYLKQHLATALAFDVPRKDCVVGTGRLGAAILAYGGFAEGGFNLVAGFDSSINVVESLKTSIPLFPASEIPSIVSRMGIELDIVTVPASAAQITVDRLVSGGIKGIVNFSAAAMTSDRADVFIRNMDIVTEFTFLSAMIANSGKPGKIENETSD